MEGCRRLVLYEPGTDAPGDFGQIMSSAPIEHIVWATRRDRGGGERLTADTQVGEWATLFYVRRAGLADIDHSWWITDDDETEWDLESISEVAKPARRWLKLYCVAKGSGARD